MGYYIRLLTPNKVGVPLTALEERVRSEKARAVFAVESGTPEEWEQVVIADNRRHEFCLLERDVVEPGSMAEDELQEFAQEMVEGKPRSAANWLAAFLPTVKVIYAFQLLGELKEHHWKAVQLIQDELWGTLGGIFQSDGEGFSNLEGFHILWQFSEDVSGPWQMAVLNDDGKWRTFEMDLGNRKQRTAFLEGRVPA